jgi:hypothetical protein
MSVFLSAALRRIEASTLRARRQASTVRVKRKTGAAVDNHHLRCVNPDKDKAGHENVNVQLHQRAQIQAEFAIQEPADAHKDEQRQANSYEDLSDGGEKCHVIVRDRGKSASLQASLAKFPIIAGDQVESA